MLLATIQDPTPQTPEFLGPLSDIAGFAFSLAVMGFVSVFILMGFKLLLNGFGMPTGGPAPREEVTTKSPSKAMQKAEAAMGNSIEAIQAKGREDMLAAWITWAFHGRAAISNDDATVAEIRSALAVAPHRTWDTARLQAYGRNLWELRNAAKRAGMSDALWRKLFITAAWVDDRRDDRFDTMAGITDQRYLLHDNPARAKEFREAYLAGGLKGVDEITRALQTGRDVLREQIQADAARNVLVEESNARLRAEANKRNAQLHALRETHQPTAAADDHAAWEAQAKELEQ